MPARSFSKIVATVEVRMTSSRLPGKHMLEVCGKPILAHLIDRLKRVSSLDEIVIATTIDPADDVLCQLGTDCGVRFHRGSEEDVMQRVVDAAASVSADLIVEITGDCPVIDPEIVEQAIRMHCYNESDYTGNAEIRSYPDGMDVQVFSTVDLAEAAAITVDADDHEHVSLYFRRHPERYRHLHLVAPPELHWPELGLTLDERNDYLLMKHIYEHFLPNHPNFSCLDVLRFLRANPDVVLINQDVQRKAVPE
jgi:spore coat polysaccharide biosynthesis protein SpsF